MNSHLTTACPNVVRGLLGGGRQRHGDARGRRRHQQRRRRHHARGPGSISSTCHAATQATPIRAQSDCDNYASGLITALRFALDSSCTYGERRLYLLEARTNTRSRGLIVSGGAEQPDQSARTSFLTASPSDVFTIWVRVLRNERIRGAPPARPALAGPHGAPSLSGLPAVARQHGARCRHRRAAPTVRRSKWT